MSAERERFYESMERLRAAVGGYRRLKNCSGRDGWPPAGVYFFFDEREPRGGGSGPRVVRVGTHGLTPTSGSTLWGRLRQHHVGGALLVRDGDPGGLLATWLTRRLPRTEVAELEHQAEVRVSEYISDLPFLWLAVQDAGERALLERNSIALLAAGASADRPSPGWLGWHAQNRAIPSSGLWNVNHVEDRYDPRLLDLLESRIGEMA